MRARKPFTIPALLSFPLAALLAAAALGGIALPAVYARETALWAALGIGQDWVDLAVVAPLLAISAAFSLRGWRLFHLVLAGTVAYAAYSLVLYAFAVHFNSLFLLYALGLGCSFYALVGLVVAFQTGDVRAWFSNRAPTRTAAVFSLLLSAVFYALWLSEIIPALLGHAVPKSALDAGLITNPVHVLDVGIVLPAFIAGGIALLDRRPLGYWLVPVMLVFGVLMDMALIGMVLSIKARGIPDAGPPLPVFAFMAVATLAVVGALLRRLDVRAQPPS